MKPDYPLGGMYPKPLPTSPCQGRSGFGSPPDKGELEGVWGLMDNLGLTKEDVVSWSQIATGSQTKRRIGFRTDDE